MATIPCAKVATNNYSADLRCCMYDPTRSTGETLPHPQNQAFGCENRAEELEEAHVPVENDVPFVLREMKISHSKS